MIEQGDIAERYMDGSLAKDIEHMLFCNLHWLNTIGETEEVKHRIHNLMLDLFNKGQDRNKKQGPDDSQ